MPAAMVAILSLISLAAFMTAPPPITAERLPHVPIPKGSIVVSPSRTVTEDEGIVKTSATKSAKIVS